MSPSTSKVTLQVTQQKERETGIFNRNILYSVPFKNLNSSNVYFRNTCQLNPSTVYFAMFIELLSLLILKVLRLFNAQTSHAEVKASLITLLVEF